MTDPNRAKEVLTPDYERVDRRPLVAGLTTHVSRVLRAGDVVFTLGAGDVTRVGPELLRILEAGNGDQGAVA